MGLIDRAHNAPEIYSTLPQLMDCVVFDQAIRGRGFSQEKLASPLRFPVTDLHLKTARNVFALVKSATSLDSRDLWSMSALERQSAAQGGGLSESQLTIPEILSTISMTGEPPDAPASSTA